MCRDHRGRVEPAVDTGVRPCGGCARGNGCRQMPKHLLPVLSALTGPVWGRDQHTQSHTDGKHRESLKGKTSHEHGHKKRRKHHPHVGL